MQLMTSDKFKFFPVRFENIVVPLGNIKYVKEYSNSEKVKTEIGMYTGETVYSTMSFADSCDTFAKAFKDCEF